MSTPARQRSRGGCWTCKQKRRKCDEAKPHCRTCLDRGVECEGYETRLRWGAGVASRGKFIGADRPVEGQAPPREKGRQRDLLKRRNVERNSTDSSASPSSSTLCANSPPGAFSVPRGEEEQRLMDEFLTSGHLLLCATWANASPVAAIIARVHHASEASYHACVAFQAWASSRPHVNFLKYYDTALSTYRSEIDASIAHPHSHSQDNIATYFAGLLLCTIGMTQGGCWTYHLEGMDRLLELSGGLSSEGNASPEVSHAIEVMGMMDLSAFIVGRQTPTRRIWRRYRCSQPLEPDSVEPVSGLPRSLIDLFAPEPDVLSETDLWLWPGCDGDTVHMQLWEAHRFAGMLHARRARREKAGNLAGSNGIASAAAGLRLPSDAVLLGRLLSSIDAVQNAVLLSAPKDLLIKQALLYPLYVAAVEIKQNTDRYQQWHPLVDEWFQTRVQEDKLRISTVVWDLLKEVHVRSQNGDKASPEDIALSWGMEVCLM